MNTQTGPDPPPLTIAYVSYCTVKSLIFLALPLSLKVHDHLPCLSIHNHRDPSDDPHHPVDPMPKKRPTDQHEKPIPGAVIIFLHFLLFMLTVSSSW